MDRSNPAVNCWAIVKSPSGRRPPPSPGSEAEIVISLREAWAAVSLLEAGPRDLPDGRFDGSPPFQGWDYVHGVPKSRRDD